MTLDKKTISVIILTICFILFGSLYSFLRKQSQPPTSEAIVYETIITTDDMSKNDEVKKTIKIYITGEVQNPGTYELPSDSRIEDAINAAGGALESANLVRINLAAHIKDAQQIHVPSESDENTSTATESTFININTASAQELTKLPQIGPSIAENIIRYREEHGDFGKIEDIKKVSRIGEKTFESIKELITVE